MKKFVVKNYKGNLTESVKKFQEAHKGMKVLEAVEDGDMLNITADVAEDPLPPVADPNPIAEPDAVPEEPKTGLDKIKDFGCKILMFGTEVHVWHLNCAKYAEHMALQELYEACDDISDKILEAAVGMSDKSIDRENLKYDFIAFDPLFTVDSVNKIRAMRDSACQCHGLSYPGIDSLLDDFCEACNSAIYKLTRLS